MNETDELTKQKNQAYSERNTILAAFAWSLLRRGLHNIKVGLAKHPEEDKSWENDWRNILVIDTPEGQMTWHFHDSEMHLFQGIPFIHDYKWDGHTTNEKYVRLINFFI